MQTKAKYRQHCFFGSVSFAASAEVIGCPLISICASVAGRAYRVALYVQPEGDTFIQWLIP